MDLRRSPRLDGAHIEFTTNCNLKCSYCAVSQPDYVGRDIDLPTIDALIADVVALRVPNVGISGHGETTSLPEWQVHARRLIDAGSKIAAISNLAKTYSTDELATLAKFHVLVVSIDTIDIELFKRLRRGGDLRRVLYNIGAVRAEAVRLGISPPIFRWTSVICDRNVFGLPSLVRYGLALGIREFSFQNLVKMPEVKGSIEFKPLAAMSKEDLARIPAVFQEIETLIVSHGGICDIQAGLREAAAAATGVEAIASTIVGTGSVARVEKFGEGMTRDCLDPWNNAYISADGTVKPCCIMWEGVGKIGGGAGLRDIFEGSKLREYRDSLLTGNLIGSCVHCHSRGWIPVDGLKAKVQEYIERAGCESAKPAPSMAPAMEPPLVTEPATCLAPVPASEIGISAQNSGIHVEIEQFRASPENIQRPISRCVMAPIRAIKRALTAGDRGRHG